jgi:hypothetical protein
MRGHSFSLLEICTKAASPDTARRPTVGQDGRGTLWVRPIDNRPSDAQLPTENPGGGLSAGVGRRVTPQLRQAGFAVSDRLDWMSAKTAQFVSQPRLGDAPVAQQGSLRNVQQSGSFDHVKPAKKPGLHHQRLPRTETREIFERGIQRQ